jgi:hypothetical protein
LAKTDAVKAEAAWAAIVERWTIIGQIAPLKPLTPEQLAASTMQAAGVLASQVTAVDEKLKKSPPQPLKDASEADKPKLVSIYQQLELLNQLRGPLGEFVRQYGGLPGQEFQATVGQALFLSNGDTIDGWLKPKGQNLVARLESRRAAADLTNPEQTADLVDELYWSVLSRQASETEKMDVARYLKTAADKPAAFGELVWALLSSTEFRFNH